MVGDEAHLWQLLEQPREHHARHSDAGLERPAEHLPDLVLRLLLVDIIGTRRRPCWVQENRQVVFVRYPLQHCEELRLIQRPSVDAGADLHAAGAERGDCTVYLLQCGWKPGYVFDGYWSYCGTVEEYWQANMDLLEDSSGLDLWQWKIRTNLDDRNVGGHQPAIFLPTAKVKQSIISSGCKISGTIERSVLSPGVVVAEGAVVRDSIIFHESVNGRYFPLPPCPYGLKSS